MKKIILALSGAMALVLLASCGTKPEPVEEKKPEAPREIVVTKEEETPEEPAVTEPEDNSAAEAEADAAARKAAEEAYGFAKAAKEKIDENNLAVYDQTRYDEAEALLAEYEAMKDDPSVSGAELQKRAEELLGKYNTVLLIGFKKLAKDERELAYNSKKLADSVKAGVAQKERYKEAADSFKEGDTLYAMQAAEKSYNKYKTAGQIFSELYTSVSEKRAEAQAAIDAAKQKVAEVNEIAVDADHTKPITGENQEGIEKEDAVLLEESEYADPKEAEAEVPETLTEAVVNEVTDVINNLGGNDK